MFEIANNGPFTRARLRINALVSMLASGVIGTEQHQVVVCGFPRSGTSLLYNMLSSSLQGFRCEPFEQYFIYRIHRLGNYATKAPMDIFHVPRIDELNINRKKLAILILVRDVRDILTSRHPVLPNEYFIGHDHSWWPQQKDSKQWEYDAPGAIEIFEAIRAVEQRPDTTIIRYEDLVQEPNSIQRNLKIVYGLPFDHPFSEYHQRPDKHAYRYEGRHAPVDASLVREGLQSTQERINRWRRRPEDIDRVVQQFSECDQLFDLLEHFRFEPDRKWFEGLTAPSS